MFNKYKFLVAGVNTKVPLENKNMVNYINFDNAATTPPFMSVLKEILSFSNWYSSIHRGKGYKSQLSSDLYDESREIVANFVGANIDNKEIIYVKNATEAINMLCNILHKDNNNSIVLSTCMEHHSNDLPWRKGNIDYVKIDDLGRLDLNDLEQKLINYNGDVKLVTVTGVSNVTGYKNPIHKIAKIAHKYNSKILVDGAQLVPHTKVNMKSVDSPEHIDYLVFSAHKMYAPFGSGVLIGPKSTFKNNDPDYVGGGTVDIVTHETVIWADPPDKDEAGTPNLMGIIALTKAIKTLSIINMKNLEKYEDNLLNYAMRRMKNIPDIKIYGDTYNIKDRTSIIPFNIEGISHEAVAKILSSEYGIGVRDGCFCAQPYIQKLLNVSKEEIKEKMLIPNSLKPGMVRISFGIYNDFNEIDVLIKALYKIVNNKQHYIDKYEDENAIHRC